ncbi:MAG: NAD+ synthase, partial [Candidatus Omnitrophota bacterium]
MRKDKIRVAIAQINPTVGDISGNADKIIRFVRQAEKARADIVCFPELALCGYPPEDLLLKPWFIRSNLRAIKAIARCIKDIVAVVGFVDRVGSASHKAGDVLRRGKRPAAQGSNTGLYNSAAIISSGRICSVYHKVFLPNYGVFDEKRYFSGGGDYPVFRIGNIIFGVNICEDIWGLPGPLDYQVRKGARLIINISASPFYMSRGKARERFLGRQAKRSGAFVVYNNLVGGQDELVFDGNSMVIDNKGKVLGRCVSFGEDLGLWDLDVLPCGKKNAALFLRDVGGERPALALRKIKASEGEAEVYAALVLGLRDYLRKNRFGKVVIGLSGGIDSSLVAVIAVDALGADNVIGVFMPSRYTSGISRQDAFKLAKNLGIEIKEIPIGGIFRAYLSQLAREFRRRRKDIAEENLQARIRGNILMALSNKFGYLVLATGNKSEVSCGYCTVYGDMAGGFSLIKDVPKTLVYRLAEFRNGCGQGAVIPPRILSRPPTAELRPGQKDSDSLPDYSILDAILKRYIEE